MWRRDERMHTFLESEWVRHIRTIISRESRSNTHPSLFIHLDHLLAEDQDRQPIVSVQYDSTFRRGLWRGNESTIGLDSPRWALTTMIHGSTKSPGSCGSKLHREVPPCHWKYGEVPRLFNRAVWFIATVQPCTWNYVLVSNRCKKVPNIRQHIFQQIQPDEW